jgi:hypothetical protein
MVIKHLLSVSLEDGRLTRFQLASLAALLSTVDKHQHASNTKYTQKFIDLVHRQESIYVTMSLEILKTPFFMLM